MSIDSSSPFSCVLMGSESLLVRCANQLVKRNHSIRAVISDNKDIVNWATAEGITCIPPGKDLADRLQGNSFDYFLSITNLRIVPDSVLKLANRGAINFHDGPLPSYAGLNVPSWALMNGETTHAITWHEMVAGVDKGDILEQVHFEIEDDDSVFALNTKCYEAATASFASLIEKLESNNLDRRKQDLSTRGYYSRHDRPPSGAVIDWRKDAQDLANLIRGLDYGSYDNPLGFPKIVIDGSVFLPVEASVDSENSGAPGEILENEDFLLVGTGNGALRIKRLLGRDGRSVLPDSKRFAVGTRFVVFSDDQLADLDELTKAVAPHEKQWLAQFNSVEQLDFPFFSSQEGSTSSNPIDVTVDLPANIDSGNVIGLAAIFLARLSTQSEFSVALSSPKTREIAKKSANLFLDALPVRVQTLPGDSVAANLSAFNETVAAHATYGVIPVDLVLRQASLRKDAGSHFPKILLADGLISDSVPADYDLAIAIDAHNSKAHLKFNSERISVENASRVGEQLESFLRQYAENSQLLFEDISLVNAAEASYLVDTLNDTRKPFDENSCLHQLFEQQVQRTPDAPALTFRGETLTYAQLDEKANRLANYLVSTGVGPDKFVGLCTDRSHDLVLGAIAIWKAGGAYVPLDPEFPADRLDHMVRDSGLEIIITQSALHSSLPNSGATIVDLDRDAQTIASQPALNPDIACSSTNLAYAIYTSGSTGKPKGVLVEHRNVSNFFTGMDDVIEMTGTRRWLAVTSLSFDISVLELFWTLTRGFEVVLFEGVNTSKGANIRSSNPANMKFSLFYFSSDEGERASDKYKLLLDGARYADDNGFYGVWTPERHFHAFGGLYPNPSVTSAALSTITKNVKLFAGSCVSPLHSPIRIAEEWSVVDNLSNGRVAIAFASGWQPNDFILQPQNYAERKQVMFSQIDDIQKLWKGESIEVVNPRGDTINVRTLPRPVQERLPVWITTAGNPETFRMAGERGYNILTHMLGQTVKDIREKIAVYREAWQNAGHEGSGHVSLMLHTFVGTDNAVVKETVREPMKEYLKSSLGLIKDAAWSFPTFRAKTTDEEGRFTMNELSDEDTDAVMELSFERYYESAGLFGTVQDCVGIVDDLKSMGVDEIACLIDFGVATEEVLDQLPLLKKVLDASNDSASEIAPETLSSLIERHAISHMQCTPSMARMLISDKEGKSAAKKLSHLMVGGEAFPPGLASDLMETVGGKVTNMYGPTETTIWSVTYDVEEILNPMPIGKPIANTSLFILDDAMKLIPLGVAGELYIGGDGVTRGYHDRAELTSERFVPNPFGNGAGKLYKTGDLCRYLPDGRVQFLGRNDFQVKIRGYRIELGEIESVVARHSSVREAVVLVREDTPGDQRIVAYVVVADGLSVDDQELRLFAGESLPDYMVPVDIVTLPTLPLTPNGKIDRKALPAPDRRATKSASERIVATPENDLESTITSIWQDALKLDTISVNDNFFDLGGHSLLAVQVNDKLKEVLSKEISLVDLFRYPTIRSLAVYLSNTNGDQADAAKVAGTSRAEERRKAMLRRRKVRASGN